MRKAVDQMASMEPYMGLRIGKIDALEKGTDAGMRFDGMVI